MRRLVLLIPLVLFLGLAVFLYRGLYLNPESLPSALIGKNFPAFNLPSVEDDQRMITEQALLGRPALVNVWGTWCVACKVEHPVLNKIAQQGVPIIGVNYKDQNTDAREWLATFHDPYVLNINDAKGTLGLDLGVYGAPETFLIDRQGVIRYKLVGEVSEQVWEEELKPRYEELLAQ